MEVSLLSRCNINICCVAILQTHPLRPTCPESTKTPTHHTHHILCYIILKPWIWSVIESGSEWLVLRNCGWQTQR